MNDRICHYGLYGFIVLEMFVSHSKSDFDVQLFRVWKNPLIRDFLGLLRNLKDFLLKKTTKLETGQLAVYLHFSFHPHVFEVALGERFYLDNIGAVFLADYPFELLIVFL